jgi:hypothetical protein
MNRIIGSVTTLVGNQEGSLVLGMKVCLVFSTLYVNLILISNFFYLSSSQISVVRVNGSTLTTLMALEVRKILTSD